MEPPNNKNSETKKRSCYERLRGQYKVLVNLLHYIAKSKESNKSFILTLRHLLLEFEMDDGLARKCANSKDILIIKNFLGIFAWFKNNQLESASDFSLNLIWHVLKWILMICQA